MIKVKRILVCGGRGFNDRKLFQEKMHEAHKFFDDYFCIIEGGATGGDRLAREWAFSEGCALMTFPANWNYHGNRVAGSLRNTWMLDFGQPDLVIAFPGGRGTRNMIEQATNRGVVVWEPCNDKG